MTEEYVWGKVVNQTFKKWIPLLKKVDDNHITFYDAKSFRQRWPCQIASFNLKHGMWWKHKDCNARIKINKNPGRDDLQPEWHQIGHIIYNCDNRSVRSYRKWLKSCLVNNYAPQFNPADYIKNNEIKTPYY